MTYNVYSIRDHLTGFLQPVVEQSDPVALRNFSLTINRYPKEQGHTLTTWRPSDFDFFRIGTFNTDTGELVAEQPPMLIASGLSVVDKEDSNG
nr:unnamed protein product [uncultured bacterium]